MPKIQRPAYSKGQVFVAWLLIVFIFVGAITYICWMNKQHENDVQSAIKAADDKRIEFEEAIAKVSAREAELDKLQATLNSKQASLESQQIALDEAIADQKVRRAQLDAEMLALAAEQDDFYASQSKIRELSAALLAELNLVLAEDTDVPDDATTALVTLDPID